MRGVRFDDPGDDEFEPDDFGPYAAPALEVDITDPEVIGVLYGPDGEPMFDLLDRRPIPFGFQPPEVPDDG